MDFAPHTKRTQEPDPTAHKEMVTPEQSHEALAAHIQRLTELAAQSEHPAQREALQKEIGVLTERLRQIPQGEHGGYLQ